MRVPSDPDNPASGAGTIEFREIVFSVPQTPSRKEGAAAFGDADEEARSSEQRRILDGVSLTVEAGTTVALLGRSGSGKTTLLRTVNGLVVPTGGSVWVGGADVAKADLQAFRRGIGYVIQETGLYPHMSIERNVAMPLELASKPPSESRRRAAELLDMVGLPASQFAGRMPWQLSGGQRQRAGVARALATTPGILLLDEPFGALDPLTRADMQTLLRDLLGKLRKGSETGTTALIVTHDLQEAVFLAQRVIFVDGGRVAADLPSHEVLTSSISIVQEYVRAVQRFQAAG